MDFIVYVTILYDIKVKHSENLIEIIVNMIRG